jgi:hypothetical protein
MLDLTLCVNRTLEPSVEVKSLLRDSPYRGPNRRLHGARNARSNTWCKSAGETKAQPDQ